MTIHNKVTTCDSKTCTIRYKRYTDLIRYCNELMIYKLGLPYVPRLISYDIRRMELVTEKIEPHYKLSKQEYLKVRNAIRQVFFEDTGFKHLDSTTSRNIIVDKNRKVWLIDFESIRQYKSKPKTILYILTIVVFILLNLNIHFKK